MVLTFVAFFGASLTMVVDHSPNPSACLYDLIERDAILASLIDEISRKSETRPWAVQKRASRRALLLAEVILG
jgi:hypothetical protein